LGQHLSLDLENEMAKRKVNKSAAIRDYLSSNPSATPSTIIEDLKKKGLKVGASLVSQVKYGQMKGKSGRRKPGRRAGASANGSRVDIDQLVQAKSLADKMGGVARAKEALAMLAKLS
jgi:hypothetical protein